MPEYFMPDEYYTDEAVEELNSCLITAIDSIKYILNIPLDHPDAKLRTPDLMEAYENLAGNCEDLIRAYKYYLEAEYYLCENQEAMLEHVRKRLNNA